MDKLYSSSFFLSIAETVIAIFMDSLLKYLLVLIIFIIIMPRRDVLSKLTSTVEELVWRLWDRKTLRSCHCEHLWPKPLQSICRLLNQSKQIYMLTVKRCGEEMYNIIGPYMKKNSQSILKMHQQTRWQCQIYKINQQYPLISWYIAFIIIFIFLCWLCWKCSQCIVLRTTSSKLCLACVRFKYSFLWWHSIWILRNKFAGIMCTISHVRKI